MTNYEIFTETLNTVEMSLQDKMKLQQAAYVLAGSEWKRGFSDAEQIANTVIDSLR